VFKVWGKGSDYFLISQMFIEKFCVYIKIMDFFCFIQLLFLTFAENTLVDDYEKKVEKNKL
jgi:hypothetical protein